MSDTTAATIVVWGCPPDNRTEVSTLLLAQHFVPGHGREEPPAEVVLGEHYIDGLLHHDDLSPLERLAELGCSFEGWEDPVAEWLGTLTLYTPELGWWSGPCDADGAIVVAESTLLEAIYGHGDLAEVERYLARPWREAMAAHKRAVAENRAVT